MTLKAYKIHAEEWDSRLSEAKQQLRANTGETDFDAFAAKIIYQRLQKYPYAYLEFGVYWWAVKQAMANQGYIFGEATDEELRSEYQGKTDGHTFVAGEAFGEDYRATYFKGTRDFELDGGRAYALYDPDMEALILAS